LKATEAIAYKHLQLLMPSKWLISASQAKSKVKTNKQQVGMHVAMCSQACYHVNRPSASKALPISAKAVVAAATAAEVKLWVPTGLGQCARSVCKACCF